MTSSTFRGQTAAVIRDIWRSYGWRVPLLILLMGTVAVVEGLGMALLLPLLTAIGVAASSDGGSVGAWLDTLLAAFGLTASAYRVALALLVVFAAQLVLQVGQQWWLSHLQRDYGARWQRRLFDAFVHAEWGFFAEHKLGDLTNLIAQETFRLAGAFLILAQLAGMLVATAVYLALACSIAWQVTAVLIALGLALFAAVRSFGRKNFEIGLRLGPLASELNVLLTEYLGGVRLIKTTSTEDVAVARVAAVIDDMTVQHTWATFLPLLVRAIFEFAAFAALCFILVFGYQNLAIPAARMLVVLALFVRLLPRFNALQQNVQMLGTYVPAFDAATRMLDEADRACEHAGNGGASAGAMTVPRGPLTIAIDRGGYRGVTTLRDVTLHLPERGVIGVVGESGAGKSTLVNCLLGLAEIQAGTVSLGGADMRDVPIRAWRRHFGYVPQDTVLFHLSIRENIMWGMPNASPQDVERAARQALAHDFILEQPHGYDSIVGDDGVRLSGGQRQRLAIARALLAGPRMLIMDEATNALDFASEAAVLETIDRLRQDICVIMVAHRLSSVRNADLIVVLSKGAVVETGTWRDLVTRDGVLSRLVALAQ
jgi:ATP-binding cassette subfamily C protein